MLLPIMHLLLLSSHPHSSLSLRPCPHHRHSPPLHPLLLPPPPPCTMDALMPWCPIPTLHSLLHTPQSNLSPPLMHLRSPITACTRTRLTLQTPTFSACSPTGTTSITAIIAQMPYHRYILCQCRHLPPHCRRRRRRRRPWLRLCNPFYLSSKSCLTVASCSLLQLQLPCRRRPRLPQPFLQRF